MSSSQLSIFTIRFDWVRFSSSDSKGIFSSKIESLRCNLTLSNVSV